jgi:hypothetical protein
VLEPAERELVEVVAGRIFRVREAVGVVVQVPGEVGEDFQKVFVRRVRARRVACR